MTKKLDKLRKNIDDIDKKLLELISNRGLLAKEIGLLKDDGVIYKPEREAQVITKLIKENKGHFQMIASQIFIKQLFQIAEH